MPKFPISEKLQNLVDQNEHIEAVYFTGDGHHHLRSFDHGGKQYTRLTEIPEVTKSGIHTNKLMLAPIKDNKNNDAISHTIVDVVSREDILKATPVKDETIAAINKNEILTGLGCTAEEFDAILKSIRKTK